MSKMKGFFKKRNSVQAVAPPSSSKSSYLEAPVSENHPLLLSLQSYHANALDSNSELKPLFAKLLTWLKFHPNTAQYITVYLYSKKQDAKYHEFRQYALKSQITEGFRFIQQLEATINEKVEGATVFSDPPHPEISHLNEYRRYWQQAVQQDFIVQLLKFEIFEIRNEKLIQNKQSAAHLISLLASIDAVPLNFIPYVHFSDLDIPNEVIYAQNKRCIFLQQLTSNYAESNELIFRRIDELSSKYEEAKEMQTPRFHTIVASYRMFYDPENRCLNRATDPSNFIDFLHHPKCIAYQDVQIYYGNPSHDGFAVLVARLIEIFGIQSMEESSIINSLCSMAFAMYSMPEVKADGSGSEDAELLDFGFELFVLCDPVTTLKFISDHTDIDEPLEKSIKLVIDAAKVYTTQWKEFLRFIVRFTLSEYLSPKVNSIRYVLLQELKD